LLPIFAGRCTKLNGLQDLPGLQKELVRIERTLGNGATLGVCAEVIGTPETKNTGQVARYNADTVFPTASVIKAAIVAELFRQAERGQLSLSTPVTVQESDFVGGSGVLAQLTPGLVLPLRDLANLAITVSDNTASNLCLAHAGGPQAVNQSMQGWGMTNTTIHRPIRFHLEPDDPPYTATGTPEDFCRLMSLLAWGRIGSLPVSAAVVDLLGEVRDTAMIARYLSVNAYANDLDARPPLYHVAHKPGAVNGVRNAAGIVRPQKSGAALALCVFTKGVRDERWTVENAGERAVAEVSRLLCAHLLA
jgi:beta-lactamase class A